MIGVYTCVYVCGFMRRYVVLKMYDMLTEKRYILIYMHMITQTYAYIQVNCAIA
jgi:hypothetical protein